MKKTHLEGEGRRGTMQPPVQPKRSTPPASANATTAAVRERCFSSRYDPSPPRVGRGGGGGGGGGSRLSTAAVLAVVLLGTCSQAATDCQAFLSPLAKGNGGWRKAYASRAVIDIQKQRLSGHCRRRRCGGRQHQPAARRGDSLVISGWGAAGVSNFRGGASAGGTGGGGSMTMLAGLSAAVSAAGINPAVVKASTKAVSELLCCCGLGVAAAKMGVLSPPNVAALSKIVYGIFLPSLLMVNVAKTIVSQPVASLLPIPVFAAAQIGAGLVISGAAMRLLKIDPNTEAGREAKVSGTFQNSGILPLIFLNAMFRGNPEFLSRGVAYVSFYLMGWSPSFWTIGNNILTGHLDRKEGGQDDDGGRTEDSIEPVVQGADPPVKMTVLERAAKIPSKAKSVLSGPIAKRILSPPIIACMAGLTIGLSPPLRWLLMREGAPLGPMWSAFGNLTAAYTPSGVLVLAGSLANCPPGKWFSRDTQKTILTVGMARWLLLPLVTSGLLFTGVRYGLVPQDPMLLFVLLVESCMPSAQNSVIMLQVAGLQDAAGRCARTLCTIYLISIIPVSILLTIFISALKIL